MKMIGFGFGIGVGLDPDCDSDPDPDSWWMQSLFSKQPARAGHRRVASLAVRV